MRTRIPPLEAPFAPEVERVLAPMMPPGIPPIALFRTFGHNVAMSAAMHGWGSYELSRELSVPMRIRELVIDRVCARCRCEYEWGVHLAYFAQRVGLTDAQIRSITHGGPDDPCWTDAAERAVLAMVDALHDTSSIDDTLWRDLAERFTPAQLLDLMLLTGWYHAISFVAMGAGVPLEPGAPRFADYA